MSGKEKERRPGHRFTPEEARAAGRKGGKGLVARRGSVHMARIGRRGADQTNRRRK